MSELIGKAKNYVAEKVANIKKPEATVDDVDFKKVSRDGVTYSAKVSVSNPYGTSLPICEVSYTLKSDGRFDLDSLLLPPLALYFSPICETTSCGIHFPCFMVSGLIRYIVHRMLFLSVERRCLVAVVF